MSFSFFHQEPKLAFEGVVASELYPCVLFYSSNPGEKVLNPQHSVYTEICKAALCVSILF